MPVGFCCICRLERYGAVSESDGQSAATDMSDFARKHDGYERFDASKPSDHSASMLLTCGFAMTYDSVAKIRAPKSFIPGLRCVPIVHVRSYRPPNRSRPESRGSIRVQAMLQLVASVFALAAVVIGFAQACLKGDGYKKQRR